MLKFVKDENVKLIDPESSLIPILLDNGWSEAKEDKKAKSDDKTNDKKAK